MYMVCGMEKNGELLGSNVYLQVNKGSVPPSFTLKDQDGKPVSLSRFKGKPVVVYFYPADETPGCTKQVSRNLKSTASSMLTANALNFKEECDSVLLIFTNKTSHFCKCEMTNFFVFIVLGLCFQRFL